MQSVNRFVGRLLVALKKSRLCRERRIYLSRYVAPNSLGLNPIDYRTWGFIQERVYTRPRPRYIPATWSSASLTRGKPITKYRQQSWWSMEKAVTCIREGERTSLWTSARLNRFFSEPPAVYRGKHFMLFTGRLPWQPAGIKFTPWVSGHKSAFSPLQEKNYALDRKMIGTF